MEKSREEVPHGTDSEPKISGSRHFDSLHDADIVEREFLAAYQQGSNLFLSYSDGKGIRHELELVATNTTPAELDIGRLYDFLNPDESGEGFKVVSILIPRTGGKAVISVPW